MRLSFRRIKDWLIVPWHATMRRVARRPRLLHGLLVAVTTFGKAAWFLPWSYPRRVLRDFGRVTGRPAVRPVYFRLNDHLRLAGDGFGALLRGDLEAVNNLAVFDPLCLERARATKAAYGAGIVVVPHCPGAVLAAVRMHRTLPMAVLLRESVAPARRRINDEYFGRLGTPLVYTRSQEAGKSTRQILRLLRDGYFLIGTTDRPFHEKAGYVQVPLFAPGVWLPDWPARFSLQRGVPILPTFFRMAEGRIVIHCDEPYVATDIASGTRRWAAYFERCFRDYPEDWFLLFDKRWAHVFRALAPQVPAPPAHSAA